MASVTLFNAARMKEIEDSTVVSGFIDIDGHLILTKRNEETLDAGLVQGTDGTPGSSAYEIWLDAGNTGSEEDFLESLKGADGADGDVGPAGYLLGMAYVWPGTSTPPEYLIPLEGQTLTDGVSNYSALAAAHPEWVDGDDIVLPDWRGRVPVGYFSGDSSFGTLGAFIGSKEVTLTAAQSGLPAHTHGVPGGTAFVANGSGGSSANIATTGGGYQLTGPANAGPSNASQAHANIQPSVVARWCVMVATSDGEYSYEAQSAVVAHVAELYSTSVRGVAPGSIDIPSGSYSILSDNAISFTTVPSISLNSIFDGVGLDTYLIFLNCVTSIGTTVATRLRAGGVDLSTGSYSYVGISRTLSAGPTRTSLSTGQQFLFWAPGSAGVWEISGEARLSNPGKAGRMTMGDLHTSLVGNGDRIGWDEMSSMTGTQAYDGFTIFAGTGGTLTGTLKVVKIG